MMHTKVIVWGCGYQFYQLYNLIKFHEKCGNIDIVGYVDSSSKGAIRPTEALKELDFEYVIVTTEKFFDEIVAYGIKSFGWERKKFLHGSIFMIPHFDWERYLQIYEKDISIIAEACYGGVLGKRLFLPMNSPFVNVLVGEKQGDYLKLLSQLDRYMAMSPQIRENNYELCKREFRLQHPQLWYDHILLNGFHFESTMNFFEVWEKRRSRYNKEKKIVFAVLHNEEDVEKFKQLECKNKIAFFPWESDSEDIVEVPFPLEEAYKRHSYGYTSYINNVFIGEGKIFQCMDVFKLLNGEKDYLV